MKQAVAQSHNEAEFECLVNNEIERLAQGLGVNLLFRGQYTLQQRWVSEAADPTGPA